MALNRKAREWLKNVFGNNVKFEEPMSRHTSLRVGGPAEAFVIPKSIETLEALIIWSRENQFPFLTIGDGTNLLVKDSGIRGIVIVLTECLKAIAKTGVESDKVFVTAMAGARMRSLCSFALDHGLAGMNFAVGIPGTVGGGIMMNAGTSYGSMEDVIESIGILLPNGQSVVMNKEQLDFSYRKLSLDAAFTNDCQGLPIVLNGRFRLEPSDAEKLKEEAKKILKIRKDRHPTSMHSAGCFYKNPPSGRSAGEWIDLAGLKGTSIGGAEVSSKHANFIINRKNASAEDILALMNLIEKTVSKMFNVDLEREVKIVGS